MIAKVISGILILITLYIGIKQGWPMITGGSEMLNMLSNWSIGATMATIMGVLTLGAAILVLFPKTFSYGNIITVIVIIYVIISQLINNDLNAAIIELPFLIMPLVLLYLGHPLAK
jgi:hypothetical protein